MIKKPTGGKAPRTVARNGTGKAAPKTRTGKSAKSTAANALTLRVARTSDAEHSNTARSYRRKPSRAKETVTLPREEFEALLEAAEDNKSRRAYEATRDEESFPAEVINAILGGANPVKTWRVYRGLKQNELAKGIGVSKSHLSEVESGKGNLSVPVLSELADALEVDMEMLVPAGR